MAAAAEAADDAPATGPPHAGDAPTAVAEPPRTRLGHVEVGRVDQARRHAPGWVQIYVGRSERWRDLYGEEGRYVDNPWRLGSNTSVEARQEVCDLCDDLTEDPEGARTPEPRQPGVRLARDRVERQRRADCIQGLVDRVAQGEDLLLLCHCRPFGAAREPQNRCHGDGIARTVRLRARAQRQRTKADLQPRTSFASSVLVGESALANASGSSGCGFEGTTLAAAISTPCK